MQVQFIKHIIAAAAALLPAAALAAEPAFAVRAGELKKQPFIDAAAAGSVAANQSVSVVTRQGGWVRVESNGQSGWMRMLNIRLAVAAPTSGANAGPRLHTGSSGKTVTTGVKGLDESNIRGSTPDEAQVAQLEALAVDPAEAASHAASSGLKEQSVSYLGGSR